MVKTRLARTSLRVRGQCGWRKKLGPTVLLVCFYAKSSPETAMNQVKMTTRKLKRLVVLRIRCTGESVCLYRLRRGEVNGPRCLFRAAARKAKRMLFTADFPASSMQRNQHTTSRDGAP